VKQADYRAIREAMSTPSRTCVANAEGTKSARSTLAEFFETERVGGRDRLAGKLYRNDDVLQVTVLGSSLAKCPVQTDNSGTVSVNDAGLSRPGLQKWLTRLID
jgi:hypothetical protein